MPQEMEDAVRESNRIRVWRLITHHEDKEGALFWTRQQGRIAIGWGRIGNMRDLKYSSADEITEAIKTKYSLFPNPHLGGASLWNFYTVIEKQDLVILSARKPRELVVEVEGDYEWRGPTIEANDAPRGGDYWHQRRIRLRRDLDPEQLCRKAGGAATGQNIHQTLIECAQSVDREDI